VGVARALATAADRADPRLTAFLAGVYGAFGRRGSVCWCVALIVELVAICRSPGEVLMSRVGRRAYGV
jgi:hypothetical protein